MDTGLPIVEFAYPGPLRDQLVAAIRSGRKTSTSSLLRQYETAGERLPVVGDRGIVVDSERRPQFTLETIDVQVVPLGEVPLAHAIAEGEGFESVDDWHVAHLAHWQSEEMRAELGAAFAISETTLVVLERFTVAP